MGVWFELCDFPWNALFGLKLLNQWVWYQWFFEFCNSLEFYRSCSVINLPFEVRISFCGRYRIFQSSHQKCRDTKSSLFNVFTETRYCLDKKKKICVTINSNIVLTNCKYCTKYTLGLEGFLWSFDVFRFSVLTSCMCSHTTMYQYNNCNCSWYVKYYYLLCWWKIVRYTLKTGIAFDNGSTIPNFLRQVFHFQIKIRCAMEPT